MWTGKAEQVYRQLRDAIELGEFSPGQQLPEIALVEKTGFSRTPVREALRQLAADGLVEIEPRRAPTVSRISVQGTRDLFAFRRVIETAAIELLAKQAATSEDIRLQFASLAKAFVDLTKVESHADYIPQFRKLAAEFDELVIAATSNRYIVDSISALKPHLARVRQISKTDKSRLPQSISEHIEICEAIVSGDSARASAVMTSHLFHVENAVFKQLLGDGALGLELGH